MKKQITDILIKEWLEQSRIVLVRLKASPKWNPEEKSAKFKNSQEFVKSWDYTNKVQWLESALFDIEQLLLKGGEQ